MTLVIMGSVGSTVKDNDLNNGSLKQGEFYVPRHAANAKHVHEEVVKQWLLVVRKEKQNNVLILRVHVWVLRLVL